MLWLMIKLFSVSWRKGVRVSEINNMKDELNRLTGMDPMCSVDYLIDSIAPHIELVDKEITELKQAVRELAKALKSGIPYLPCALDKTNFGMGFIGLNAEEALNNPTVKRVMEEGGSGE